MLIREGGLGGGYPRREKKDLLLSYRGPADVLLVMRGAAKGGEREGLFSGSRESFRRNRGGGGESKSGPCT